MLSRVWRITGGAVVSTIGRPFRRSRRQSDAASSDPDGAIEAIVIDDTPDEDAGLAVAGVDAVDEDADLAVAAVEPQPPAAGAPAPADPPSPAEPPNTEAPASRPSPAEPPVKKRWVSLAPAASAAPGTADATLAPAAPGAAESAVVPAAPVVSHGAIARLPTGKVERTRPGAPWWRYRRPEQPTSTAENGPRPRGRSGPPPVGGNDDGHDGHSGDRGDVDDPEPAPRPTGIEGAATSPSGVVPGALAAMLLGVVLIGGRLDAPAVGRFLIPVVGVAATVGIGRWLMRRHPDEPWLGRFLLWGVVFKLVATWFRYSTFEGGGDAIHYDQDARRLAAAWFGSGEAPVLNDLRKTNFVRWFCGIVYELFGSDMIMGFFAFGLLAFIGTYLWYRAAVIAVPFLNRRLYLGLVLFAPSIAFWPSSIGKESLMQLAFGLVALGTAHLMHHRLLRGLLVAAPGGWLMWVVRPHLLAIATVAVGIAYLLGRRTSVDGSVPKVSLMRPIGAVVLALLVAFAVTAGADSLGIEELSVAGIEQELQETNEQTSQGSGKFESGGGSLSPVTLPLGLATVLLRPFPWEVETANQIVASLESAALAAFVIYRRKSLWLSLTRARTTPFLLYCWVLMLLYSAAFSSFGNFGILVRQRSLILSALLVLVSLDAVRIRAPGSKEQPAPLTRGSPVPIGT